MGSKPVAEGGHKGWIGGQILNGLERANSTLNEVTMEELHSELSVIANFSALKMRASATSKMAVKGIKYVEIDAAQDTAFPLNECSRGARDPEKFWALAVATHVQVSTVSRDEQCHIRLDGPDLAADLETVA
jgi:hypothetical protein